MSEFAIFGFMAVLFLGYGLFSALSERSVITAPMVFVTMGIAASFLPFDLFNGGISGPLVKIVAELALVLVLFTDASTINLKQLIKERRLPIRLLFIGLPLTMLLGFAIAIPLFTNMPLLIIALMALILSPTDAALGQAVVTSKLVPEKIRQTINVESGLNDGFALPPILICIAALSTVPHEETTAAYWAIFTLKQFIYGPLIGGAVGWAGGFLVDKATGKGWMNSVFQRLSSLAIAILAFSLAEVVHGNGFIAAFFAGLLVSTYSAHVKKQLHDFGEAESQALALFIFLLFGLLLVPAAFQYWDLRSWVYAILSLTVIRMLPVAISLIGSGLSRRSVTFIGWFGPRGIASVLYLLLVLIDLGVEGYKPMMSVVVLTVLLSIFLHGLTAIPLSKLYQDQVI